MILIENGKITQVRISIPRLGKHIRNIALIFSRVYFTKPIMFFYDKHSTNENKKIVKYYVNNKLDSYAVTEFEENLEITKVYSSDGYLFSKQTIEFDENNKPISEKGWVENADGTFDELYDKYSEENL